MSKHVTSMSKHADLHKLIKKNTNKMISMVRKKTDLISTYWYRTLTDDKYKTISIVDIMNIIITYHMSSKLAENDDNINSDNIRICRKCERKKVTEEEDIDGWV